jgi:hypothetical protein
MRFREDPRYDRRHRFIPTFIGFPHLHRVSPKTSRLFLHYKEPGRLAHVTLLPVSCPSPGRYFPLSNARCLGLNWGRRSTGATRTVVRELYAPSSTAFLCTTSPCTVYCYVGPSVRSDTDRLGSNGERNDVQHGRTDVIDRSILP